MCSFINKLRRSNLKKCLRTQGKLESSHKILTNWIEIFEKWSVRNLITQLVRITKVGRSAEVRPHTRSLGLHRRAARRQQAAQSKVWNSRKANVKMEHRHRVWKSEWLTDLPRGIKSDYTIEARPWRSGPPDPSRPDPSRLDTRVLPAGTRCGGQRDGKGLPASRCSRLRKSLISTHDCVAEDRRTMTTSPAHLVISYDKGSLPLICFPSRAGLRLGGRERADWPAGPWLLLSSGWPGLAAPYEGYTDYSDEKRSKSLIVSAYLTLIIGYLLQRVGSHCCRPAQPKINREINKYCRGSFWLGRALWERRDIAIPSLIPLCIKYYLRCTFISRRSADISFGAIYVWTTKVSEVYVAFETKRVFFQIKDFREF